MTAVFVFLYLALGGLYFYVGLRTLQVAEDEEFEHIRTLMRIRPEFVMIMGLLLAVMSLFWPASLAFDITLHPDRFVYLYRRWKLARERCPDFAWRKCERINILQWPESLVLAGCNDTYHGFLICIEPCVDAYDWREYQFHYQKYLRGLEEFASSNAHWIYDPELQTLRSNEEGKGEGEGEGEGEGRS